MQIKKKSASPSTFREDLPWLCTLAVAAAFLGWLGENLAKLIFSGGIDSRFHLLPFLSPYALLVLFIYAALRDPDDIAPFGRPVFKKSTLKTKILSNLISFLTITAAIFLGELLVGNFWELTCGVVLWDYTDHPPCFTRYTSLITAIGYGVGGYIFFRFLFLPAFRFLKRKLPRRAAQIIGYTFGALILLDTAIMGAYIAIYRKAPVYWSIRWR